MALPEFSMRQLLEAGVHFGHQTHRWNPKMAPFIFGERNNIHIIDLAQTVPMLYRALQAVSDTVAEGGRVLFVGTKRQASDIVADGARRSAQYFVNARWLGGMLTNWKTISNSINRLKSLEHMLDEGVQGLTKKELLSLTREREKLERALGGIKDMGGLPSLLFVVDTNKEAIAVAEARRLVIPVAAIVDTNCDPEGISLPVPGNDDAGRAIALYCDLVARAVLDGISRGQTALGADPGAMETVPQEEALAADGEAAGPSAEDEALAEQFDTAAAEAEEPAVEAAPADKPAAEPEAEESGAREAAAAGDGEAAPADKPAPAEPEAEESGAREAAAAGDGEAAPADKPAPAEPEAEESGAREAAAAGDEPLFEAPEGEPDDLKRISGVGPVLEGKLHSLGITRFSQIANFDPEDIERVDQALNFKGRIERDDWIGQASKLAAGE